MKKRIVFITDCTDIAYNELRAIILSYAKDCDVEIEPVVSVAPFSIINGNFILRLMGETYPEGTIFSIILNPLKERPARLIGKTKKKNFFFMSANTGVLDWFLKDLGIDELYELNDPGFFSFGGKYVHAPTIAKIALGKQLNEIGKPFNQKRLVKLDLPEGTVVHIDNFGLIKFIGKLPKCKDGDKFKIEIANKVLAVVYAKRMMNKDDNEWVIYPSSSLDLLELGKVRNIDGAKELNINIGDTIKFRKI